MIDAFCMAGTPEIVRERAAAVAEHADGLVVGSPLARTWKARSTSRPRPSTASFKSLARFSRIENRESPLITPG